jgi:hypothetical protein
VRQPQDGQSSFSQYALGEIMPVLWGKEKTGGITPPATKIIYPSFQFPS